MWKKASKEKKQMRNLEKKIQWCKKIISVFLCVFVGLCWKIQRAQYDKLVQSNQCLHSMIEFVDFGCTFIQCVFYVTLLLFVSLKHIGLFLFWRIDGHMNWVLKHHTVLIFLSLFVSVCLLLLFMFVLKKWKKIEKKEKQKQNKDNNNNNGNNKNKIIKNKIKKKRKQKLVKN